MLPCQEVRKRLAEAGEQAALEERLARSSSYIHAAHTAWVGRMQRQVCGGAGGLHILQGQWSLVIRIALPLLLLQVSGRQL